MTFFPAKPRNERIFPFSEEKSQDLNPQFWKINFSKSLRPCTFLKVTFFVRRQAYGSELTYNGLLPLKKSQKGLFFPLLFKEKGLSPPIFPKKGSKSTFLKKGTFLALEKGDFPIQVSPDPLFAPDLRTNQRWSWPNLIKIEKMIKFWKNGHFWSFFRKNLSKKWSFLKND